MMDKNEMPLGFSMALAMNSEAMQAFALLSDERKREIVEGTHALRSRDEMHRYVQNIVSCKKTDINA